MKPQYSELTMQFEAHEVDASTFGHKEHVLVAYEMLHKYSFLDASTRYAKAINTIATKAGAPEKFNMTITLAFLSLIAERVHTTTHSSFEGFLQENNDLLSKNVLRKWYSDAQLHSDFARTHFLLPTKAA
jgi:hypothetical protein